MQQKSIFKEPTSGGEASSSKRRKLSADENEIIDAVKAAVRDVTNYGTMTINFNVNQKE